MITQYCTVECVGQSGMKLTKRFNDNNSRTTSKPVCRTFPVKVISIHEIFGFILITYILKRAFRYLRIPLETIQLKIYPKMSKMLVRILCCIVLMSHFYNFSEKRLQTLHFYELISFPRTQFYIYKCQKKRFNENICVICWQLKNQRNFS